MMKNTIFVSRHGEVKANKEKRFRGWTDFPLDENGKQQASDLADKLKKIPLMEAHSSDLIRSKDSAETVAKPHKLPVQAHKEFRPWNVGDLAGQKKADHKKTIDDAVANPDKPLPGGESLNQFRARFRPKFKELQAKAKAGKGPLFMTAHASNLHEIGTMIHGKADSIDIAPGGHGAIYPTGKTSWGHQVIHGQQHKAGHEYEQS